MTSQSGPGGSLANGRTVEGAWCLKKARLESHDEGIQEIVGVLHYKTPAHAVPLASARQHPENQKKNQAGNSPERTVEGQG